ncbi:hypothetical protein OPT61_g9413 [Boeremia exigua]|uniref:Uncharacterized protein n=1 Tax=Boeremia exigua TaxID=749465 RepID=A0ACC2HU71_9PLEO|nr:hypothetical protein OPT61_g9413 [Boeremia exigua]
MSEQKHTKVLIAGGSIAGLTLANTLEQLGIEYLLLEKYSKIAPDLGASIGIFPNGFRILDQLGCYDAIKALVEGADAFQTLSMKSENGQVITEVKNASKQFNSRLGYEPIFVDRQMIIQILYERLRDKSRVLTDKGVVKVEQSPDQIKVVTADGDIIFADILIGADGIHSTVRREMWRLADQHDPGCFQPKERLDVPTEYCCIFGISRPSEKFPRYSSQNIQGQNYSYLIATGPNHRIYWFLFKKLPNTSHGLYDKIPRYTEDQRDALAAERASDRITDTLTFGELYAMRTTATLQALPEVVFKKWYYNRIMTIGDAAHKFNPIGGQGGNSAIEDAAVLADQLYALSTGKGDSTNFTDANVGKAFAETQRIRSGRAKEFLQTSHNMQSMQAMDTPFSKFVAKYIVPLSGSESVVKMICRAARGAARIKALPMPQRPHSELWDDERGSSLSWKYAGCTTFVTLFAVLVLVVWIKSRSVINVFKTNSKQPYLFELCAYHRPDNAFSSIDLAVVPAALLAHLHGAFIRPRTAYPQLHGWRPAHISGNVIIQEMRRPRLQQHFNNSTQQYEGVRASKFLNVKIGSQIKIREGAQKGSRKFRQYKFQTQKTHSTLKEEAAQHGHKAYLTANVEICTQPVLIERTNLL